VDIILEESFGDGLDGDDDDEKDGVLGYMLLD
jgi:hypothetical protein